MKVTPRKACADVLYSVYKNKAYLNEELKKLRKNNDFSPVDYRFINEIVTGVVKNKIRIDYIIGKNSSIKLNKISLYVLCLLEIGVYQLIFMDKVPESAAVNETVKLTKTRSLSRSTGFVNAVLRSVIRTKDSISYPDDKLMYSGVYYSIPQWLLMRWEKEFGSDFTCDLCRAFCEKSDLFMRTNTLKTDANTLCQSVLKEGIDASVYKNKNSNIDYLVECKNMTSLSELSQYKDGLFYIQDFAAALTVEALDVSEGMFVVDTCAAPGGKSTHIAEKMKNKGKIISFDIHENKLAVIKENASRLGIDIIYPKANDSRVLVPELVDKADRVLVDAPCSGLGILKRKPDIKYFRSPDDISSLAKIGYEILETSSKYLKKDGILVYSTCTIEKEENDDVINKFLENNKNFEKVTIDCYDKENSGSITLFPNTDFCDGFYICKLKRIE